jgi:hypothetical protein
MFIQNKYKRWYDSIISGARLRLDVMTYSEKHHILPRSLGGNDSQENLIVLTAREHFVCHVLLTKFTTGNARHKMLYAANMMSHSARDYQHRYIPSSRLYEMVKREFGLMHSSKLTGRVLTKEHKAKISAAGVGRVNSPATIAKRSASCTGKTRTVEQKERMSNAQKTRQSHTYSTEEKNIISQKISTALKNKPKSEEHKQKLSKIFKGKSTGLRSEETKQKMRKPKSEAHRKAISDSRIAKYAALRAEKLC